MTRVLYYPPADRSSQWYSGGQYGGSTMSMVNAGVLHTTEGPGGWPGYQGGAVAPTLTMLPIMSEKRCVWRQHFRLNESGRALANKVGGVQTNTLNVVQIEMVGTSIAQSEAARVDANWRSAFMSRRENVDYVYWGDPPDWALKAIADFARFMRDEWPVPLAAPGLSYVSAVAAGDGQRMSFDQWTNFNGWCGHEHVPENDHRDPGRFPIARMLTLASGATPPPVQEDDMPTVDELLNAPIRRQGGLTGDTSLKNVAEYSDAYMAGITGRLTAIEQALGALPDQVAAEIKVPAPDPAAIAAAIPADLAAQVADELGKRLNSGAAAGQGSA